MENLPGIAGVAPRWPRATGARLLYKDGAELLFEVVSRGYERQSIVLTSTLPFENWPEILGNERLTGALPYWSELPIASTSSKPTARAADSKTSRNAQNEEENQIHKSSLSP